MPQITDLVQLCIENFAAYVVATFVNMELVSQLKS